MTSRWNRRAVMGGLAGSALVADAGCKASTIPADPHPGQTLRQRANAKGLLCGSCLDIKDVDDLRLREVLKEDCNILVPENGFNWTRLQRQPGAPLDYSEADAVFKVAQSAGVPMRGHNMVWYRTMPAWAEATIPEMTAAAAGDLLVDHCRRLTTDWKGRLIHHEVVNEPTAGRGIIPFSLSNKLGEHYIDLAFAAVQEADPAPLRCLNINMVEMISREDNSRRLDVLRLLENLRKRDVPVQCLGIEGHLRLNTRFDEWTYARFLQDISDLGLKILITEFDVNDRGAPGVDVLRDDAVAALGRAFLDVSFAAPHCLGLLTWGLTDKVSWLRKASAQLAEGKQRDDGLPLRPAPRDDQYQPKPLWYTIAKALDGAPARLRPSITK